MYSVSTKFLEAIRTSGEVKTVVDIYYGTSPIPIERDIPVISGSLTIDRTSDNRRSGQIIVGNPARPLWWQGVADRNLLTTLEPWGVELVVRSGVVYPNGQEELVPLGRFRIDEMVWKEGSDTQITINMFDRSRALQDSVHLDDRDFSGKSAKNVIGYLVAYAFSFSSKPTIVYESGIDDITLPGGSVYTATYWETMKAVSQAMLAEPYFNVDGELVIAKPKVLTHETLPSAAVWNIDVGSSGVLVEAQRTTNRADTYNAVAVYGGQDKNNVPFYATATDDDPKSLTWYKGKFGRKNLRISNEALMSNDACAQVAQVELAKRTGLSKTIDFTSLRNPALDAADVVLFTFLDGSQEIHMIDTLTIPVGPGTFTGQTRSVQWSQ